MRYSVKVLLLGMILFLFLFLAKLEELLRARTLIFYIILILLVAFQFAVIFFLFQSLRINEKIQMDLNESKKRFKLIFDNMKEGFALHEIVCDDTGKPVDYRFLDVNKAFESITNLKSEEIINKTVLEVLSETEAYWIKNYGEVALTGKPISFENYSREMNRYFSVNVFSPEKGKLAVIYFDVTEIKIRQENLIAVNKELAAVNTLKDKLFAVFANDIHEPLAELVNLSELLIEEKKNYHDDSFEIIGEIQNHVRSTFIMVENLLEWFRSRSGGNVFDPRELDLSKLVQEVVQMKNIKAEAKNIRILYDVPAGITVYADREMLALVLRNLLSNAIKFTAGNGSIIINAEMDKEMAVVSVKDTGVGIQPERVQLIFQDAKDNTTIGTEGESGLGLGLFISKQFIQRIGGDIWVDSIPGEGSNFFITIPAHKKTVNQK